MKIAPSATRHNKQDYEDNENHEDNERGVVVHKDLLDLIRHGCSSNVPWREQRRYPHQRSCARIAVKCNR